MNELIVGTDFTGLGSFEEALKRLKVKHRIAFACDKDKHVKQSYLANHAPKIFYDDIVLRDQSKTPYSDIYCFGFPCQAFSLAGNRKGFEDTRGTLFFNSLSYIKEKQPIAFIGENVKGLLSHDKAKGSKSKYGRTFGVIRDALAITVNGQHNLYKYDDCVNYHIYFKVLNSKEYGIPQNRERVFIIGFRDEVNFKFPSKIELKLRLIDMVEKLVDDKYFISDSMVEKLVLKKSNNSIGYINQDTQASKVFTTENVSPTLSAGTHGYANGYILEPNMLSLKRNEKGKKIRKAYEAGLIKEKRQNIQDLLPRSDGISNTITTNTNKENYILFDGKPVLLRWQNNKDGIVESDFAPTLRNSGGTDIRKRPHILLPLFGSEINSQGFRVYDENGIAVTQSSGGGGLGGKTGLYLIDFRIRRLTPKEVFRLMGFSDEFFTVCQSLNSDTQLYKQGGNSIVVDTMMWLLVEVCQSLKIPFTMPFKP